MHCPRVLAGTLPREEGGPNKVSFPGITNIVRTHLFTTDKPLTPHRNSVLVDFQPEEIWKCFFARHGITCPIALCHDATPEELLVLLVTVFTVYYGGFQVNIAAELFAALIFESCFQIHDF